MEKSEEMQRMQETIMFLVGKLNERIDMIQKDVLVSRLEYLEDQIEDLYQENKKLQKQMKNMQESMHEAIEIDSSDDSEYGPEPEADSSDDSEYEQDSE